MPIEVAGSDVVDVSDGIGVGGVSTRQDVLFAEQLHVQATLGLPPKQFDGAGEHDDKAVSGVDRLRHDAREVGGLAALHVADDEALGLVSDLGARIGEPADDVARGLVEVRNRTGIPSLAFEHASVSMPVEVVRAAAILVVPRHPVFGIDDHRVEARGAGELGVQSLPRCGRKFEQLIDPLAPVRRRGFGDPVPVRVALGIPLCERSVHRTSCGVVEFGNHDGADHR
ncbi:hypothetical protein [Agromyces laixinhei]|uniref:hypothetical protein n=1 Tax=Agromyces laixinhei TaxID=2585717 RepID=UPI0018DC6504|nr:hypothetical protein [Agromyces laixinhei]